MTIGLTYDDLLSRVQLALSDRPDGTVLVQRVANAAATEALWARSPVRGGLALPVVGGVGALDDFEFFADILNHYRVSPVDPPPGLLLDGTAGNSASTPDTGVLDITGDLDLRADISPVQWANGANQTLVAKYDPGSNQRSYQMFLNSTGQLSLGWSTNGTAFTSQGATLPSLPSRQAVRVTLDVNNGASGHVVRFYSASTIDGPFVLFSDFTGVGTTSIHAGTAALTVGAQGNTGAANLFAGTILAAEVRAPIGGGAVADPDFAAQPHGTTGFTDSAGRTWTVQGDALINGTETDSITPSLAGKVWLKSPRYPGLNRPIGRVRDIGQDIQRPARDSLQEIAGSGNPVATTEVRGSRRFTLAVKMTSFEEGDELDILLAAGRVWFIHVPAASKIPGGYVRVGDTNQKQTTVVDLFEFTLPCTVVAPPPPQMTGTLLTAETVFRLYGDANALYAAHATGRSLLATILDPSDLVVI